MQQRLLRKEVFIHLPSQFAVDCHGDVLANHEDALRHRPVVNLDFIGGQCANCLNLEVLVLLQLTHLYCSIDDIPKASDLVGGVAHAVLRLDSLNNYSQKVTVAERKVDVISDGEICSQRHLPVRHYTV